MPHVDSERPAREARAAPPEPDGPGVSPRRGPTRRLSVVGLVLAILAGACGGPVSSPHASAPSPTAASIATPKHTETRSPASPTPRPSASPAGSSGAITPCPGTVEVVRSLGTTATDQSTDWAGYAVSSTSTPFTCVEATWTQPKVVCRGTSLSAVAFWVGIGGVRQAGLVQAGTQTQCLQGSPTIGAWHQSLPREPYAVAADLAVAVGDRIHTQVLAVGRSSYSLTVENLTTGATFTVTSTNGILDPTTAEWIVEAPTVGCPTRCTITSLPDFGTVTLSDVSTTIDGVNGPLDAAGFVHTRTTLVTTAGLVRAKVSSTSSDGRSFAVTWVRP
jgi:Peptidase A4 family